MTNENEIRSLQLKMNQRIELGDAVRVGERSDPETQNRIYLYRLGPSGKVPVIHTVASISLERDQVL